MIVRERNLKATAEYLNEKNAFKKLSQLDTSGKFALSSDNDI